MLYFTINLGGGEPHQFFVHQTSNFRGLSRTSRYFAVFVCFLSTSKHVKAV